MAGKTFSTVTNLAGAKKITAKPTSYPREQTDDFATQQIQENVARQTASARSLPMADGGVYIKDVQVSSVGVIVQVAHGLGRAPLGWIVCRPRTSATIFELGAQTNPRLFLGISASGTTTFDLWVW